MNAPVGEAAIAAGSIADEFDDLGDDDDDDDEKFVRNYATVTVLLDV